MKFPCKARITRITHQINSLGALRVVWCPTLFMLWSSTFVFFASCARSALWKCAGRSVKAEMFKLWWTSMLFTTKRMDFRDADFETHLSGQQFGIAWWWQNSKSFTSKSWWDYIESLRSIALEAKVQSQPFPLVAQSASQPDTNIQRNLSHILRSRCETGLMTKWLGCGWGHQKREFLKENPQLYPLSMTTGDWSTESPRNQWFCNSLASGLRGIHSGVAWKSDWPGEKWNKTKPKKAS